MGLSFWIGLSAIACSSLNREDKIRLTVGIEPTFPPFAMRDDRDRLVGFDVDLVKAIAEQSEIEISLNENFAFNDLIPALERGEIDAIASGILVTSKRAEKVAFSRPYFQSGLAIAIQAEDERIDSINDLKDKTIAVQIGTKGARKAEKIAGAKVSKFSSITLALQALKNGNIDAVIHDLPAILYAIKIGNFDGLRIAGDLLTTQHYSIALPKDSPHIEAIDDALEASIADRTYEDIYRRWFNSEPPSLPEIAPVLE